MNKVILYVRNDFESASFSCIKHLGNLCLGNNLIRKKVTKNQVTQMQLVYF